MHLLLYDHVEEAVAWVGERPLDEIPETRERGNSVSRKGSSNARLKTRTCLRPVSNQRYRTQEKEVRSC